MGRIPSRTAKPPDAEVSAVKALQRRPVEETRSGAFMARAKPTRTKGREYAVDVAPQLTTEEAVAIQKDLHERKGSARLDMERAARIHDWKAGDDVCIVWELIEGFEIARDAVILSIHHSELACCDVCVVRFPDNGEQLKMDVARVRKRGYITKIRRKRATSPAG